MEFSVTSEWVSTLRRDIKAWDARPIEGPLTAQGTPYDWPDMTPPLKYTDSDAELGPGKRRRRASTGMDMGRGRHPPSEIYRWREGGVAMRMRLPVHVWGILLRGQEAESVVVQQVMDRQCNIAKGVGRRLRWREWDGERHRKWRNRLGEPRARVWTEWHVQRMEWERTNGIWRGQWKWEKYEDCHEWDTFYDIWRDGRHPSTSASNVPWHSIPQEVLLEMVDLKTYNRNFEGLATACGVCRTWLAKCAPKMYRRVHARTSRVKELIEDASKPGSCIPQYTKWLTIRGPLPWAALPKLLKLLPHLSELQIGMDGYAAARTGYHPTALHMLGVTFIASPDTATLTTLTLGYQWFSSTSDTLRLLASFPRLCYADIYNCTFRTVSTAVPLVPCTHLKSVSLSSDEVSLHGAAMLSIAQWWRWPREPADPAMAPYRGLHRADAQAVFSVIRSIPFDLLKWRSVNSNLSLSESWHAGSVVLCATVGAARNGPITSMDVELHVAYDPPEAITDASSGDRGARIEHAVIRLVTSRDLPYENVLGRMEAPLLSLPHFRSVTLETPDPDALAELRQKLASLHAVGKLRLRTCKEAQRVAEAAKQDPSGSSEVQGIVSPLWYSENEKFKGQRNEWSEVIAETEQRRKETVFESTAHSERSSTEVGESGVPTAVAIDSEALSSTSSGSAIAPEPPFLSVAQTDSRES